MAPVSTVVPVLVDMGTLPGEREFRGLLFLETPLSLHPKPEHRVSVWTLPRTCRWQGANLS